ncbi:alanine racemase [Paenibacillus naphthalenovorans]|uniref:Alanine racemase n=1 Tax=Paenibacillus naphthalenovorans TaxID=162209 RepID=A0A0U2UD09_9BACL|nr:alanine racemase [Paenibacillus naphthalenovorans]ALS24152.1 alanine racemase [Paenibacillus naphthalenovorans]SDJ19349.1 alanine racemase [Paenibacillus naphthalenovorans]
MDSFYRPTRVEISLDALRHNLEEFRRVLPEHVSMMAVVKADAYGHGAVEVCREALSSGVKYIAVAFLDEGLELRQAGITAPILVLGYTPPEGLETAWENDITLNVYTHELLDAWERLGPRERPLNIHIKIDSGMNRLGLTEEHEAIELIERAMRIPGLRVEGLFTHYACADETDKSYTLEQYGRFERVVEHFHRQGIRFPWVHAGNSAAAIDTPNLTYNMVRLGISMYGLYPSEEVNQQIIDLQPVLSIKSAVVMVKKVPPGAGVSYGAIYRTEGEETIATLPIGYADGFSRILTGKAQVLIKGQRVPIVGRICMDQCMMNVTGLADISVEEEVVILGSQGEERITAEEHAQWLGTINYEVICMISHRVPRVYIKEGRVSHTVNPLLRHRWERTE